MGMLLLGQVHSVILDLVIRFGSWIRKVIRSEKARLRRFLGGDWRGLGGGGAGEIVNVAGVKTKGGAYVNVTLVHPEGWGDEGPRVLPVRSS